MTASAAPLVQAPSATRSLGILWIVYGVARLIAALWLAGFASTATVMFGALLTRVADPFSLMSGFHFIYWFIIVLTVVAGIFSLLAGLAMLSGKSGVRPLALIAAVLSLSDIPLGLTLGVFTLVFFLSGSASRR